ncbi:MAG: tail fiber domain-containing protein, partial [Bacteroidales bacterium]|nr:tail fiber domain-containing protein [Bacteroidales bacterium]
AGIPHNALTLYKSGNMTIGGSLTQNSDKRLKENIVNMENVLPNVLKINPVYYEFKNKEIYSAGRHIGFIAQDVQKYYPDLVLEGSDGLLSIDYSRMTVVLLQAINEQQALIEKQQADNDELKAQIEEINRKLEMLINK